MQEFNDIDVDLEKDVPTQIEESEDSKFGEEENDNFEVVISDEEDVQDETQQEDKPAADSSAENDNPIAGEVHDDDLEPYSVKVRQRIMRERKIARDERERANRLEAELSAEKALRAEAETHLVSTAEANIDAQIAAKKSELKAAKEIGDTDTELNLLDELDQLRADKRTVKSVKAVTPEREEQPRKEAEPPRLNAHTQAWLKRNPWMSDKGYAIQINAALVIDAQMAKEGFDPNTSEYFEEWDRRIDDVVKVPRKVQVSKPKNPVQRSVGVGDSTQIKPSGKIVLTREDLANMRRFGLDPENKDNLREYAKNKRESQKREGEKG